MTETESKIIIGDEGDDLEEHPFYRLPPRSHEPIYLEDMSKYFPKFDDDEIDVNEEEYALAQKVFREAVGQEDELVYEVLRVKTVIRGGPSINTEVRASRTVVNEGPFTTCVAQTNPWQPLHVASYDKS